MYHVIPSYVVTPPGNELVKGADFTLSFGTLSFINIDIMLHNTYAHKKHSGKQ